MAVQWESGTMQRAGELWSEFPENVQIIADLNGRHENTEIDSLIADIEVNGQHTPVGFRKGDNGMPVLVYGHRRYRALMAINKKLASKGEPLRKLLGTYLKIDEQQAFLRAISENRERKDVSPIDDAHNITTLIERFKYSLEEIAKIYFPEAKKEEELAEALRFVKQRHALAELAPEAEKVVREGRIKITAAVHLAKLSREHQRSVIASQPTGRIKVKTVLPTIKGTSASTKSVKEAAIALLKTMNEAEVADLDNTSVEYISFDRKKVKALYRACFGTEK